MALDGAFRNVQLMRDLPVAEVLPDRHQHLDLTCGQRRHANTACACRCHVPMVPRPRPCRRSVANPYRPRMPQGSSVSDAGARSPPTRRRTMAHENPNPDALLQLGLGFWASKALLTAVELDVFSVLAEHPLGEHELTDRLGLQRRGTVDWLDALVS